MMNITSAGNISAAVTQADTGDAASIAVLKKSLDIQAQNAMQLLQALPLPSTSNPPNLGNSVNTFS